MYRSSIMFVKFRNCCKSIDIWGMASKYNSYYISREVLESVKVIAILLAY